MSSYQEKLSKSAPSFDRKNLSAALVIVFGLVLMTGYAATQVSAGYDVSIGQNGIEMGTGTLDVMGNDIESSGTTVFDGSAGQIATSVVNYSAATATDVGLGNADNADELDLDGSESMGGNIDLGGNRITTIGKDDDRSFIGTTTVDAGAGDGTNGDLQIHSVDDVVLDASGATDTRCILSDGTSGEFSCDVSKNWIHDLENGSEAFYTSQESPEVRAVYEGKAHVVDSKKIKLPEHFSITVSDSDPMLRAQATPQGTFTKAVVMDKTDDYIEIKVGEETDVNFRITGIREGYEDKQVVRPKEE